MVSTGAYNRLSGHLRETTGIPDSLRVNLPGLSGLRGLYYHRVASTYGGDRDPRGGASWPQVVDGNRRNPAGIPASPGRPEVGLHLTGHSP